MYRKIIKINEAKCDGCGICVPACAEGALQVIDGKIRLISDFFCDGLGACIGECPQGALQIVEREAEPYNEYKVMDYIVKGGPNVIKAHLEHMLDHGETGFYNEALDYLNTMKIPIPAHGDADKSGHSCGCAGSAHTEMEQKENKSPGSIDRTSQLRQWPVQLHLLNPNAQVFQDSDLLLAADCCGFASPAFHNDFLKGKTLAIACPKLDNNKQVYLDKLITLINSTEIRSLTVMIMQVPCCGGLFQLANQALEFSERRIPLKLIMIGVEGNIIKEVEYE